MTVRHGVRDLVPERRLEDRQVRLKGRCLCHERDEHTLRQAEEVLLALHCQQISSSHMLNIRQTLTSSAEAFGTLTNPAISASGTGTILSLSH